MRLGSGRTCLWLAPEDENWSSTFAKLRQPLQKHWYFFSNILKHFKGWNWQLHNCPSAFNSINQLTSMQPALLCAVFVCYVHADTLKVQFLFIVPFQEPIRVFNVLETVKILFSKRKFCSKKILGALCTSRELAMRFNTFCFATLTNKWVPHLSCLIVLSMGMD